MTFTPRILIDSPDDYQLILHALCCAAKCSDDMDMPDAFRHRLMQFSEHFMDSRHDIICQDVPEETFNQMSSEIVSFLEGESIQQMINTITDRMLKWVKPQSFTPGDGTVDAPVTLDIGEFAIFGLGRIQINLAAMELDKVKAITKPVIVRLIEAVELLQHTVDSE